MFYANFILSKKGPLARVWLAAHWEKKLSKAHVFETDVESSVESIMSPKVKMALRTSGHLLLGVVRIYSRKAKYLLADCTEAFVKIKMAFRPGMVDLPEDGREATMSAVTLPEVFNDFDMPLPGLNDFDIQVQFNLNQSRAEEITLKEDFIVMNSFADEGFGDILFGEDHEKEILREGSALDESSYLHSKDASKLLLEESGVKDGQNMADKPKIGLQLDDTLQRDDFGLANDILGGDGFGDELGEGVLPPLEDLPTISGLDVTLEPLKDITENGQANEEEKMEVDEPKIPEEDHNVEHEMPQITAVSDGAGNETTIVQNEAEAFVLEPVEVLNKEKRSKRKRKLIVDDDKILDSNTICDQLADTTDIVKPATLAPPTKLRMRLKEASTSDKLFKFPVMDNMAPDVCRLLKENLTAKVSDEPEEPAEELDDIESPRDADQDITEEQIKSSKSPRKRRSAAAQSTETTRTRVELSPEAREHFEENENDHLEDYGGAGDFLPDVDGGNFNVDGEEATTIAESEMTEDQGTEEKDEEFQERRWTKRTQQLMHTLKRELRNKDSVSLDDLAKDENRKHIACKFYSCLLLKRDNEIKLQQKVSFGQILISKGPCFYS